MNSVSTLSNNGNDTSQAGLSSVKYFPTAPSDKTSVVNSKDNRIEDGFILFIKRAIDKNIILK